MAYGTMGLVQWPMGLYGTRYSGLWDLLAMVKALNLIPTVHMLSFSSLNNSTPLACAVYHNLVA